MKHFKFPKQAVKPQHVIMLVALLFVMIFLLGVNAAPTQRLWISAPSGEDSTKIETAVQNESSQVTESKSQLLDYDNICGDPRPTYYLSSAGNNSATFYVPAGCTMVMHLHQEASNASGWTTIDLYNFVTQQKYLTYSWICENGMDIDWCCVGGETYYYVEADVCGNENVVITFLDGPC